MDRAKLYSVAELKERGWTATAITRFLPAPDDERDNPYYRSAAPMRLWLRARVHRVEKTKRFLAWWEGADSRKYAAAKAVETRVDKMVDAMRRAEITIVRGKTDEEIRHLAEMTHGGNYQGDPGPFHYSARKAINTIRHRLTNYESLWNICNRGLTGREAYDILRERVDALVEDAYPQYFAEERAIAELRGGDTP